MQLRHFLLLCVAGFCAANLMAQPFPPGSPAVSITEIMYNPPESGTDSLEFIELRNPSPTSERSLSGHFFTSGIEFSFPMGFIVQPHQFVVVAKDSVAFENAFGVQAFQWVNSSLLNEGEAIVLKNSFNQVVDSVFYSDSQPWPTEAAGNGASIVLCNDTLENAGPTNWVAANTNTGVEVNGLMIHANPGADCSGTNAIDETPKANVLLFPNPNHGTFSLVASTTLQTGVYDLRIIDLNGRSVISKNVSLGPAQQIDLHESLRAGIYLLTLNGKNALIRQRLTVLE